MTTQLTLPAPVLDRIVAAAHESWTGAIIETFRAFGIDLTDPDGPSIRPGDYAIPSDQWGTIAEACAAGGSDLARTNHMLDWMNYGPSAFEPEPVAP